MEVLTFPVLVVNIDESVFPRCWCAWF